MVFDLVETAGVEPASKNRFIQFSTSVVSDLDFAADRSQDKAERNYSLIHIPFGKLRYAVPCLDERLYSQSQVKERGVRQFVPRVDFTWL